MVSLLCFGCQNFGTGGTGELVVPKETLRNIDTFDVSNFPTPDAAASTLPTTEPTTRPVNPAAYDVPVTIERVRELALHNNLDLKVELLNPTIAKETLNEEESRFEWTVTANVDYSNLDRPTASQLTGSQVKDLRITPGLTIPLRTGGTIQVDVPMERFETNSQFSTLNPSYTSNPLVTFTQPLLRGFGVDANANRIRVAFYNYQQTEARTKLEVILVLANADRAYWRLYAARQVLLVRKQEYDLANAQLERARRQVRAGVVAEVEVVRAESGVADKLEAIITAENDVRDRERDLKRILNEPELAMDAPSVIVPASEPRAVTFQVNSQRVLDRAMQGRMELLDQELQILAQSAQVAFARNDLLPLVTVQYQYGINGLGDSFDQSFSMVRDMNYQDQTLGLQVSIPIGNEAARSRLRGALARRLQDLATLDQRRSTIKQEVLQSIDRLEANWQQYLAARQRVVLAARVLDVEIRQFDQGLRTSTDVLDAQTRLANARADEIGALASHQIAQVDVAFATGTLLGASHVQWSPVTDVGR